MFFGFVGSASAAGQALLSLSPVSQAVSVGDIFTIDVVVDPHGVTLDTVRANLNFSADKLQVISFDLGNLYPTVAPGSYFDNSKGMISEGGTVLGGEVKIKGVFGTITFQATTKGNASIAVLKGSKLIRAGKENINQFLGRASVTIGAAKESAEQVVVQSPTNPTQDEWVNKNSVEFNWSVVANLPKIEKFLYSFDQIPNTDPVNELAATVSNKKVGNVKDGVWYFHIKGRFNAKTFSKTNHYRVMIDTVAPEKIMPVLEQSVISEGAVAIVRFSTTDQTSGIDYYEVAIDDGRFIKMDSPATIDGLKSGKHTILVRAFDQAGNISANAAQIIVNPKTVATSTTAFNKNLWLIAGGILILIAIIVAVILIKKKKPVIIQ